MTLGEKIASARKEKGMTQEMLAEKLGVTWQAVARWETGKALPGTANLFMLRQLLGIPLEAADMEATDLEGTTGTEKSGTLANTEKAESLTAKQKWMLLAAAAILLWFALQFVGLGAAVGLLLLLLILIIVLFLIATGKSGIVAAAKSTGKRMLYLIAAMLLALVLWSVAFVASANYQSKAILEYAAGGMAELPRGCRMDAALRNNGKWCLYAAGGPAFRPGEYNRISCLPQWRDQ